MGFLRRLLGQDDRDSEALTFDVGIADFDNPDHVEVDVVGEASYQATLADLAGRKSEVGKQHRVGVTLRCEPTNQYDRNAVRVEVMGQVVGYLPRGTSETLCSGIANCGGAVEGQGLIVGGWKSAEDEGHFGIRVWLPKRDADRIGLRRPSPIPELPAPLAGETRLSPTGGESQVSSVTVTCEEHYQPSIDASVPTGGWNRDWWPCVATLSLVERNPHKEDAKRCVEVRVGGHVVGYLTPAMSERYADTIERANASGFASARAQVFQGTKGGANIWRVKLAMTK